MQAENIALVRESFPKVAAIAKPAAAMFYQHLFEIDPTTPPLFANADMEEQGKKLMAALGMVVASLTRLDQLVPVAQEMARRHVGYGVTTAQYDSVGASLIWTLEQGLGDDFTPALRAAWLEAYTTLAGVMVAAAEAA